MDQGKVTAVVEWPTPQTIKELQRFLGFANVSRRFIKSFSLLTAPLTTLLRGKPKSLSWSSNAHEAFDSLKTAFSMAPILRHPDPHVPFVVEVDASTTGAGAVLSQLFGEPPRLQPCAYYSKKLTSVEQNYDIGNRELLAIKLALEEWRHWLEGANHPFTVITDHKNLQYLRQAKRLNPRQARWALFFTKFDFTSHTDLETETVKLTLYPEYIHLILPRNPSQFSLQPSLSAPSSGTSTRTSEPPLLRNLLRWEVQKGKLSFQSPYGDPFWTQCTKYRALDIQAANGPSRSKLGTGGPVCPVTPSGTSAVAQSVPCPRLLVIYRWASSYLSPFLDDPGHTWEYILRLTFPSLKKRPASS